MAFDYKKEFKEFYLPPQKPGIVLIPPMNYLAVRGQGDPNAENGEYSTAAGLLYAVAYTLKMSYKTDYKIDGYFEYVVPPLEGLWWQTDVLGVDYKQKDKFCWISMIRLPDFIEPPDFAWAINQATQNKNQDFSKVELFHYDEGLCVQCMHIGHYDNEPATVKAMDNFAAINGYIVDITESRHHHEIYLSDPRKTDPDKLKTVLRHPVITLSK